MSRKITVCESADDLARVGAERIADAARAAIAMRGLFTIALSGGSTPERMFQVLAQPPYSSEVDWPRIRIFIGDERYVPVSDERSNFGMAKRSLLDHVPIPAESIFAVDTAQPTVQHAAKSYEDLLLRELGAPPSVDLSLLGMGDDGHTASLFPHAGSLHVTGRWVVDTAPGLLPPPVDRVTFTWGAINASRSVLFVVSGEKKAEALRSVLEDSPDPHTRPSAGINPSSGELEWLIDRAAAKLLRA